MKNNFSVVKTHTRTLQLCCMWWVRSSEHHTGKPEYTECWLMLCSLKHSAGLLVRPDLQLKSYTDALLLFSHKGKTHFSFYLPLSVSCTLVMSAPYARSKPRLFRARSCLSIQSFDSYNYLQRAVFHTDELYWHVALWTWGVEWWCTSQKGGKEN